MGPVLFVPDAYANCRQVDFPILLSYQNFLTVWWLVPVFIIQFCSMKWIFTKKKQRKIKYPKRFDFPRFLHIINGSNSLLLF